MFRDQPDHEMIIPIFYFPFIHLHRFIAAQPFNFETPTVLRWLMLASQQSQSTPQCTALPHVHWFLLFSLSYTDFQCFSLSCTDITVAPTLPCTVLPHVHCLALSCTDFHCISLLFTASHCLVLIVIDFRWFSLIFADFHWLSLIFTNFHWFS